MSWLKWQWVWVLAVLLSSSFCLLACRMCGWQPAVEVASCLHPSSTVQKCGGHLAQQKKEFKNNNVRKKKKKRPSQTFLRPVNRSGVLCMGAWRGCGPWSSACGSTTAAFAQTHAASAKGKGRETHVNAMSSSPPRCRKCHLCQCIHQQTLPANGKGHVHLDKIWNTPPCCSWKLLRCRKIDVTT